MANGSLTDHLPPHNLEAERGVLGAILLDSDCLYDIAPFLIPEHFYRESHQTICRAMLEEWNASGTVDIVMLFNRLQAGDKLKLVGGDEYLGEIANSVPHAANARHHAEIVRQKWIARQVIQGCTEVIRDGYSNLYTAQQLLESAEQKIFAISQSQTSSDRIYTGAQAVDLYTEILDRRREGEVQGLTTNFVDLNELLNGLRPKQLLLLAGRPGQGKTSLAMDLAWHVTNIEHQNVLVVSLEMSVEELTERMVSSIAGIDSKRLKDPYLLSQLSHSEDARMLDAMVQIRESRLRINDCVGQSVTQIASIARRMKARDGLGFLVIDYLGKIRKPTGRGFNTENDQLTYISNALKELSGELRIPVLALHQLNRQNVNEGTRPKMHHLRGSGSLEQDADVVMLIHNAIPDSDMVGQVELIVDKNRGGPTGVVYLTYEKQFTRFSASTLAVPPGNNGHQIY